MGSGRPTAAITGARKYAALDQIDRETVSDLEVVWRWASPDNAIVTANRTTLPTIPAAYKATPVLVDGVLYVKTSMSQAAAIDAATGETLWVFDPGSWEDERPANTGYNARGVAYWSDGRESRVFLPTGNAYLWAVDARTGRPIANFGADGAIDATQGLRRPDRATRISVDVGADRGRRRPGRRLGRLRRTPLPARTAG